MLFGIRFSEHGDRYFAPEKPHVRICEGLGRAISLFYSTCGLQTAGLIAYYPFLVVSGCLAGAFTGLCAQLIIPRLRNIHLKK